MICKLKHEERPIFQIKDKRQRNKSDRFFAHNLVASPFDINPLLIVPHDELFKNFLYYV